MDDYDFIYKIIIVGDDSVGKTSFLARYIENIFIDDPRPTIGVEFRLKMIELEDGKKVKLQIWDTAGQKELTRIIKSYFVGAHGIILFYDISNRESFKDLEYWFNFIKNVISNKEPPHIFLVGNKSDKENERMITAKKGELFAKNNGLLFFESSAKTGKNVDLIFMEFKNLNKDPVFQKIQEKLKKQRIKEKKEMEEKKREENWKKNQKILYKYISF